MYCCEVTRSFPIKQFFLSVSVRKQCLTFNFALWCWTTMHVEAVCFGAPFSHHLQGEWIFTLLWNVGTALSCYPAKPQKVKMCLKKLVIKKLEIMAVCNFLPCVCCFWWHTVSTGGSLMLWTDEFSVCYYGNKLCICICVSF